MEIDSLCLTSHVLSTEQCLPCQYPRKCTFDDISEIARANLMKNNQNSHLLTTNGYFRGESPEILVIYTLDLNTFFWKGLSQAEKQWKWSYVSHIFFLFPSFFVLFQQNFSGDDCIVCLAYILNW